ncbi:DUF563 domain-containing protein [Helicobacter sp. MIT 14-3879]|uniref:glycosyltransferase family 61 protein n=1 Tax=Helicobacter sp. MIT 14-3879 TaxID=2040649 RepID=UPI000E1F9632|nr:glycosyltransferase family 61 protein [Helicobacter sp. MIT 14-3879]RDU61718.1 hypothetical protein CQA44_08285 [Helicobacter sp. MIT 14-3879]
MLQMKIGGGQLEILKNELENKSSVLHIPLNEVKIYHKENAKLCSYGGVFEDNKVINESLNSSSDQTYQQEFFDYLEQLSIFKIKNKDDLKAYIKKFYFKYLSLSARKNRKIFNDKSKPKIIFFCAWFSNMYHFVFESYARLLILLKYARDNNLDFYIVAPPKYRGFARYYKWFINEILELENIPKILYLDYQNYDIKNIYFCSNPQCNEKYILPAINKIQNKLYDKNFPLKYERIFISRNKSPRRYLVNEDEILELLESRYGFKRVYMEDYNLKEKVNLMMNANVILSIDGTSIINGLFMNKANSKIIALRSSDMTDHMLLICGAVKGIEYLPIICDLVVDSKDFNSISCQENKHSINSKGAKEQRLWVDGNLYLNKDYLIQKLKEYEVNELDI